MVDVECEQYKTNCLAGLLEVGNDIVTLLGLLETVEGHLGSRNVLLLFGREKA